ncbi:MAG: hypothetical protein KGL39_36140 [Patescibacteria group bacterium]|nr:hypothetical protein [Patescibacteria group bacterium]
MSAVIEPPVAPAAAPAAPVSPAMPAPTPRPSSSLPTGISVNHNYDPGELYEKHVEANRPVKPAAAPAAPASAAPAPEKPAAAAAPVTEAPKKDDAISQLADRYLPKSATPEAAAPPAEPGPEANPEDRLSLSKDASPKAHESFAALKTVSKGLRDQLIARDRELTDLKGEVEKLRSGAVPVETPELVKLKAEHEAMSKRLMVLDLQSHPRFQQEFIEPRNAAETEARAILQAHGQDANIDAILNKSGPEFRKAISEIAAKLPTTLDQADFANAMRTAQALKQKADSAVQNASQLNQTLKAQTSEGFKKAFDEVSAKAFSQMTLSELHAPAGAPPEAIAEVEAFNNGFRALRGNAEKLALGASAPQDIAAAAIRAAAFDFQSKHVMPMVMKSIQAKDARIAELEAQLTGLRARNPNHALGVAAPGADGMDPTKMDNKQAAEYFYNKRA